jgi:hypothetical protein
MKKLLLKNWIGQKYIQFRMETNWGNNYK